jgi:hypothetical protein
MIAGFVVAPRTATTFRRQIGRASTGTLPIAIIIGAVAITAETSATTATTAASRSCSQALQV